MKKALLISLVCIILFGLVGCKEKASKAKVTNTAPLSMLPGGTNTDYPGVEIQLDSIDWHETKYETTLRVIWSNNTPYEVVYGEAYTIERLDGAAWVSCSMQDELFFNDIAYILNANAQQSHTYVLTHMYDVVSPGRYRFKTDCYVHEDPEQSSKCQLTAEFSIHNTESGSEALTPVNWRAQYVRTNGSSDGVLYPGVRIIHSAQELTDYYNTWQEAFDLVGFWDACKRYDETFFKDNYLIFVVLEEGSGSISHKVRSVTQTPEELLAISIDRQVPEVGTCDMAQWHIILELSRDVMVENSIDTMLYIDGMASYMDDTVVLPQEDGKFSEPPAANLRTPAGDVRLAPVGFSWFHVKDGMMVATLADVSDRPNPKSLQPVNLDSQYRETIYAPLPGTEYYEPIRACGYLLKLDWEANPHEVTYTCWDAQGQKVEQAVYSYQDQAFYATMGGHIYEITATWKDTGAGYYGTANYYVYIIG